MLVDSEVISCRAHADVLTRHGYPITADQVLKRFLGVSDREARQTIEREMGRELPDDFEAQMKQAALDRYASELAGDSIYRRSALPRSICRNAWRRVARPRKSAMASPAPACSMRLRRISSRPCKSARGKPAPDLFLFAAEQMNTAPERCIVIEDSVPGVTGGRAAGMTVLGFHGGSHCTAGHAELLRAAGAAVTFDDMRQLPDLIERIGADQAPSFRDGPKGQTRNLEIPGSLRAPE